MFRKFFLTVAVAVAVGFAAPSVARADFLLELNDGSANVVKIDLTTGLVTNGGTATISAYTYTNIAGVQSAQLNILYDGYAISTQAAQTNTPGGSISILTMSNTHIVNNNGSAGNLTIETTANGYNLPTPQQFLNASFDGSYAISNTQAGSSATATAYYNTSNTDFGTGPSVVSVTGADIAGTGSTNLGGVNNTSSLTDVLALTNLGVEGI